MTNEELTKKYKELTKIKTGEELSDAEAFEQAIKLVTLVKAVYQPIPQKDS